MKLETKIANKITWTLWHYSRSDDTIGQMLKRRFWHYVSKYFKVNPCVQCGKLTKNQERFADDYDFDPDSETYVMNSYSDYCCKECYEGLLEKL